MIGYINPFCYGLIFSSTVASIIVGNLSTPNFLVLGMLLKDYNDEMILGDSLIIEGILLLRSNNDYLYTQLTKDALIVCPIKN